MLQLVLGVQKSGKTEYCLKTAESAVKDGKSVIMLVPEQYSFECQRLLLDTLGAAVSNKIEIHSFTSLCEAVCAVVGGCAGITVDDGTRFILVGQALKGVRDSLKVYAKYVGSTPFVKQMMSVITEFKQSSVSPEELLNLSESVESEALSAKLHDVSLIMSAYNALTEKRFADPLDLPSQTVARLRDNSFFKSKTVIIDEFKGFTEAQYKLLDRLIAGCEDTYVSLCCDSLTKAHDTDVFANVKQTAARLCRIAENHTVEVAKPEILSPDTVLSPELSALERYASEREIAEYDGDCERICVCKATDVYAEADFCMNTIHRLVRSEGFRYRDFVLISRNDSVYPTLLKETAELYGIPCYIDTRVPVTDLPFTVLMMSAVKAADSLDTDELLKLAKTGLAGLSFTEAAMLENYVFVWSISGKKWLNEWTMKVGGLNSLPDSTEEKERLETEKIEALRKKLIAPIKKLGASLKGTAADMCAALFRLVEEWELCDRLGSFTSSLEKRGLYQQAEYQRAGYDVFVKVLDKIAAASGDAELTPKEFCEILCSALKYETVGEIPQTVDQVVYGTADRIKPMRPKVAFVLGANQDVFPSAIDDTGFFSRFEREKMISGGLKVADRSICDCIDEKFMFYAALTCASEKVFISYSERSASGATDDPAAEVLALCGKFKSLEPLNCNGEATLENAESEEASFRRLAESFDSDKNTELKGYFAENKKYSERFAALLSQRNKKKPSIAPSTAETLYGEEVRLSASKADDFAGCKFLYFCKYGLSAKRPQKVDFDPLTRGNIVHYCLEKFISAHLSDIGFLNEADIRPETDALCDKYLEENGTDTSVLDQSFVYMLSVVKDTVAYIAVALNREFAVSAFRPKHCELKVGDGERVKGIDIFTNNGRKVTLNGYIDRVDMTDDGKIRVVDYKTGSKGDDFKLSELLDGQNLQMLLYLYAALKNGYDLLHATKPAGVLYFPAKRVYDKKKSEYIKMNGIVLDNIDTVKQMEPTAEGRIIPPCLNKNGDTFNSRSANSLISEEAFGTVFRYIELVLQRIGNSLMSGDITPLPMKTEQKTKCAYCDYKSVCRYESTDGEREPTGTKNDETLEIMKKEIEEAENGH